MELPTDLFLVMAVSYYDDIPMALCVGRRAAMVKEAELSSRRTKDKNGEFSRAINNLEYGAFDEIVTFEILPVPEDGIWI